MPEFDAVFVGLTILDVAGRPVEAIPAGGGISFIEEIRMNPAGTAAGAVMNAAKMGIKTATVACVGDDEQGRFILDAYQRMGIDCSMVQVTDDKPTSATILTIRPEWRAPGASPQRCIGRALRCGRGFRQGLQCALFASWRDRVPQGHGSGPKRKAFGACQEEGVDDDLRRSRPAERNPGIHRAMPALCRLLHAVDGRSGAAIGPH